MAARQRTRAVVLLSGGLDSTTCLALARAQERDSYALTVAYGQRHAAELRAAARVALALGAAEHRVVAVDLGGFGGSALTADIPVPKHTPRGSTAIPVTYVPARNTVLLAIALAWAEVLDAAEIWIGVNAVDYSGYPDCRPEFLDAFERLARVATQCGVERGESPKIIAPLVALAKSAIIRLGLDLGVDYSMTFSCYDPGPRGAPCGACDACRIRREGFAAAGAADPLLEAQASD